MSKTLCREDFEMFVMMLWALWTDICKRSHESVDQPPFFEFEWVGSLVRSFRKANAVMEKADLDLLVSQDQRWQPSFSDHLRLDVDAGFESKRNLYSIGAIFRNHLRQVVGAKSCNLSSNGAVKGAELLAIRLEMDICLNKGFSNISIFSDSVQAVCAPLNPDEDIGPNGFIAQEIHSFSNRYPMYFFILIICDDQ